MNEYSFTFTGDEELGQCLEAAIQVYPDLAEQRLRAAANRFKREVRKKCDEDTKEITGRLKKDMKVGKTRGYGNRMEVDFMATAPHFHLVEHGHELITPQGERTGFVQGKHMVKRTAENFAPILDKELEKVLKEVRKRSKL